MKVFKVLALSRPCPPSPAPEATFLDVGHIPTAVQRNSGQTQFGGHCKPPNGPSLPLAVWRTSSGKHSMESHVFTRADVRTVQVDDRNAKLYALAGQPAACFKPLRPSTRSTAPRQLDDLGNTDGSTSCAPLTQTAVVDATPRGLVHSAMLMEHPRIRGAASCGQTGTPRLLPSYRVGTVT